MLRYLEVLKEQVNCGLPAFLVRAQCCCLLPVGALLMERVTGEGQVEQLHARSRWIAAELAERSAVQGLGTHSKSPTGPQPVYDRAEEDRASTALERARPLVFKASHWKASAGGFVQALLAKTHWTNK